jgi:enoyl-CoA hydratase/carnithine racemase
LPAAAATSGSETVSGRLVTSGVSGTRTPISSVVIAMGVFNGVGRIVEIPRQPGDPPNVSRDDLVYPEGTMHLVNTTVGASVTVNPHSCLFRATLQEDSQITGGTGLFAHASGTFTGTISPQGCCPATPTAAAPPGNHRCMRWTWSRSARSAVVLTSFSRPHAGRRPAFCLTILCRNPREEAAMDRMYRTLRLAESDEGVLSVVIDAPPMNLIGPELVRELVRLLGELESGQDIRVMVVESADPEYFVPHVDLTKVAEYTAEAGRPGRPEDASLVMLWHKLSELPTVTIAKIRGRARGAGSELALACDMRFAARQNAILGQIEVGVGATPGAGGVQHLARLLGRGRAMEAILGADDYGADQAERYGWVNRALPDADLDAFVARLARCIASFPRRRGAIGQARAQRADPARRFRQLVASDTAKSRTAALFTQGLPTHGPLELDLGDRIGALWQRNRSSAQRLAAPPPVG